MEQTKLWFEQSALQALPKAQHALGVMYRKMRLPGRLNCGCREPPNRRSHRTVRTGDDVHGRGIVSDRYRLLVHDRRGRSKAIAALSTAPRVLPIPCFSYGEYLDKSVIKMCACRCILLLEVMSSC